MCITAVSGKKKREKQRQLGFPSKDVKHMSYNSNDKRIAYVFLFAVKNVCHNFLFDHFIKKKELKIQLILHPIIMSHLYTFVKKEEVFCTTLFVKRYVKSSMISVLSQW